MSEEKKNQVVDNDVNFAYMATPYATTPAGTGADYGLDMLPPATELVEAYHKACGTVDASLPNDEEVASHIEKLRHVDGADYIVKNIDSLGGIEAPAETEFEKSFKHHPLSDWRANITHDEIDAKDISPEAKEMMHASLRQFENQMVAKGDYDGNVMWTRQKHNGFKNRGMGVTRAPASKRKLKKKKK